MQLLALETIERYVLLSRDNAYLKSCVPVNELSESFTSCSAALDALAAQDALCEVYPFT